MTGDFRRIVGKYRYSQIYCLMIYFVLLLCDSLRCDTKDVCMVDAFKDAQRHKPVLLSRSSLQASKNLS